MCVIRLWNAHRDYVTVGARYTTIPMAYKNCVVYEIVTMAVNGDTIYILMHVIYVFICTIIYQQNI